MIFGKKNKTIEISNNKIKFDNENSKGRQFYLLPYRGKEIDPHSLLKTLFSRDGKFSVGYYKKNNGGQYIRFWAEEGRDQVESAILTNFRKSQIEEADGFMNTERNLIGGALHLRSSDFFPLKMRSDDGVRNSDREDDLAKHIFAELRDSQGEYLVQILFKGAKDFNFSKYVIKETFGGIGPRKKIKRLDEKDISKKSDQLARDIEEKMKDECFKVQIRFLGSGASEEELVQTFNNVSSALSQFNYNTSDGNKASLKLINPDNLKNFVSDVKNREFHDASKLYQKVLPFLKKDPHPRFLCSDELKYFLQIPVEDLDEYRIKDAAKKEHPISARGKEKMEQSEVQAIYGKTQRGEKAKVTDFRHHVYVSGKTGMGKSTVLQHLTLNRIKKGKNVIVLDPHGDLINEIIQRIDRDRLKDVIYISPHSPLGFNALNLPGFPKSDRKKLDRIGKRSLKELEMSQNEKHARALSNMIKDHFGDEFWGPRLDSIFNWFAQGLLDEKGSNFVDFYHILCDEETARKFAKDTQMQELEHYINTFFNQLQDRDKHSTLNKIGKIRRSKVLRKMLCIRQPDLQISELIEDGKIVFINLSKGLHDSDTGHFIGSALSNLIWSCIQQRLLVRDEKKRGETYLVVDEFQSFANDIFKDMLSEGRKVGLRLVLANQYLGQLDHDLWKAIAGNVETFINFASSVEDAKILSDYYGDKVEDHEFVNLQKFNALANYEGSEVNSVRTNPPSPPKNNDLLEDILERMERISPNEGMKKQRANTPIWSNEETERWDILTGIYRKQIE
ncbi:MAG: type IV secretory system conjugative DNA transfer family protein, partial [Thermoplasmatota archaeon]